MTCVHCGEEAVEGRAFCPGCGHPVLGGRAAQPVARICPDCASTNTPESTHCYACGHPLAEPIRPRRSAPAREARPSARLTAVRRDGTDGPSYEITVDPFDIGRGEGSLLFEDPHMATRHARITYRDGQFFILPLDTRNGIYVQVREVVELFDGDYVLAGRQVLRFEVPLEIERTIRPALEHGVVLFGTPLKPPWGRLRQVTAAGTTRDVYHLSRADVILGREQGDIIFSDDEFLSRRHAQIQWRQGRITLQDLGSSNGTFLRLRGEHPLTPGEMVRMGDELLRFEIG